MAGLGTRFTIERVNVGHSLPKAARACALLGVGRLPEVGRVSADRVSCWRPSTVPEFSEVQESHGASGATCPPLDRKSLCGRADRQGKDHSALRA